MTVRRCRDCKAVLPPPKGSGRPPSTCGAACPRAPQTRAQVRERLDQIEDLPEELEALAEHLLAWLKQDGAWLGEPAIERWAEAHQVDLQDARRCLDWLVSLNDVNARGLGVCPQWRAA